MKIPKRVYVFTWNHRSKSASAYIYTFDYNKTDDTVDGVRYYGFYKSMKNVKRFETSFTDYAGRLCVKGATIDQVYRTADDIKCVLQGQDSMAIHEQEWKFYPCQDVTKGHSAAKEIYRSIFIFKNKKDAINLKKRLKLESCILDQKREAIDQKYKTTMDSLVNF